METSVAFVVMPWTGIAPFSKVVAVGRLVDREPGDLDLRERHGDDDLRGLLGCLPVSGSVASILSTVLAAAEVDSRSSTAPVESADVWRVTPATSIVTVPPGIVVPRRTYEDVASSTRQRRDLGSVTSRVGGLAKRMIWTAR